MCRKCASLARGIGWRGRRETPQRAAPRRLDRGVLAWERLRDLRRHWQRHWRAYEQRRARILASVDVVDDKQVVMDEVRLDHGLELYVKCLCRLPGGKPGAAAATQRWAQQLLKALEADVVMLEAWRPRTAIVQRAWQRACLRMGHTAWEWTRETAPTVPGNAPLLARPRRGSGGRARILRPGLWNARGGRDRLLHPLHARGALLPRLPVRGAPGGRGAQTPGGTDATVRTLADAAAGERAISAWGSGYHQSRDMVRLDEAGIVASVAGHVGEHEPVCVFAGLPHPGAGAVCASRCRARRTPVGGVAIRLRAPPARHRLFAGRLRAEPADAAGVRAPGSVASVDGDVARGNRAEGPAVLAAVDAYCDAIALESGGLDGSAGRRPPLPEERAFRGYVPLSTAFRNSIDWDSPSTELYRIVGERLKHQLDVTDNQAVALALRYRKLEQLMQRMRLQRRRLGKKARSATSGYAA
eukprot:ctg_3495.g564